MDRINEFTRGGTESLKKTVGIGFGNKINTKAWKVLDFVKSFGEEGVRLTEIQKYIYVKLNGGSEEAFYKKDGADRYNYKTGTQVPSEGTRSSRGYWTTALYGGHRNWRTGEVKKGILRDYCRKNKKGKWVFDHYPTSGGNIYNESWDQKIICKPLKNR